MICLAIKYYFSYLNIVLVSLNMSIHRTQDNTIRQGDESRKGKKTEQRSGASNKLIKVNVKCK